MFPISNLNVVQEYEIEKKIDENYRFIIEKELEFIDKNKNLIFKNSKLLYDQKIKNLDIGYIKSTVDFKLLEKKAKQYSKVGKIFEIF
jgi:protein AbiQ